MLEKYVSEACVVYLEPGTGFKIKYASTESDEFFKDNDLSRDCMKQCALRPQKTPEIALKSQ